MNGAWPWNDVYDTGQHMETEISVQAGEAELHQTSTGKEGGKCGNKTARQVQMGRGWEKTLVPRENRNKS